MVRLLSVSLPEGVSTVFMIAALISGCDVYTPDLVGEEGQDNGLGSGTDSNSSTTTDIDTQGLTGTSATNSDSALNSMTGSVGTTSNPGTGSQTNTNTSTSSASTDTGNDSGSGSSSATPESSSTPTSSGDGSGGAAGTDVAAETMTADGGADSVGAATSSEPAGDGGASTVVVGAGGSEAGDPPEPTPLIDDMEDGNAVVLGGSDRVGTWFAFNDCQDSTDACTGTQTPVAGETFVMEADGYGGSDYAAHSVASGFSVWGSGFGVNLNGGTKAYDASSFVGITFWAKGGLVPASAMLRVEFVSTTTDAESSHFGFDICLSSDWQEYSLPFAEAEQPSWAADLVDSLDSATIKSINFKTAESVDHDIWVDDLSFMESAASAQPNCP